MHCVSFARVFWMTLALGLFLATPAALSAQEADGHRPLLVPRPPLGWNSWDSYGLRINEQQFRDNVDVFATRLKPAGYSYAVIDEGWYMFNPQDRPRPEQLEYDFDAFGRFIPVPDRFPSSLQRAKTRASNNSARGFTPRA
jgi:hypothetical protein